MKKIPALFILLFFTGLSFAQTGTLKGRITSDSSPVTGANISIENTMLGAATNLAGYYFINDIQFGKYKITITHLGYESVTREVLFSANEKTINLDIELKPSPVRMGEVMISGTRFSKTLREEAIPLEVIQEEEFRAATPNSLAELVEKQPGVTMGKDGIWATDLNIRGLSKQNLVLLIDGNRVETSTAVSAGMSLINPDDIERVEVIKGGTSSLYGTGAMGGVVNIITKSGYYNDGYKFGGAISGSYNSVNKGNNNNIALNVDNQDWYARVSFSKRTATDIETPDGVLPNSSFRDKNISAELGVKPHEKHELKIKFQQFKASDVGIPGGEPFPGSATARYIDADRDMISAEYSVRDLFPSLRQVSAKYFYQLITRNVELIPNPNAIVTPGADHIMHGAMFSTYWEIAKNNIITAGVDMWEREYNGLRTRHVLPTDTKIYEKPVPDSKYRNAGIFFQNDISFLENKLHVRLGARIDYIDVKNDSVINPLYIDVKGIRNDNPNIDPLASYKSYNVINRSWGGNLAIMYNVTKEFDLTLNLARSFRSPNLEERYQFLQLLGQTYLGNPDLKPEESQFFDLGMRIWNKGVTFKINGFINRILNLVVDEYDNTDNLYRKQNVGTAMFYGYDIATEFALPSDFTFYANLSYVRGVDTGNDEDLPRIPPLNSLIGIKSPLLGGIFGFDFSGRFVSNQKNTAAGEANTGGYAIYDFSLNSAPINLNIVSFNIYAGVENIFDRLHKTHLSTYRGINTYEPGRNLFIKAVMNF